MSDKYSIYDLDYCRDRVNPPANACHWAADDDENWETSCHEMFVFAEAGPIENGFRWCPYCGRTIAEVVAAEPED